MGSNIEVGICRCILAALFLLFRIVFLDITATGAPKFLTLPFTDPSVNLAVQQGWIYSWGSNHYGVDYIKGEIDKLPWEAFDVYAAADGVAMWSEQYYPDGTGYGKFVLIKHDQTDASGNFYFTLYGHLLEIAPGIPYKDKHDTNYSTWKRVYRGEYIGRAGATGVSNPDWIHLHFEVFRGGYCQNRTDPFDIYKKREYYPGWPLYQGCGYNYLWTSDPPVPPISTYPERLTIQASGGLPWFCKGQISGNPAYWRSYTYGGITYFYTWSNGAAIDYWAGFRPFLSRPGVYEVYTEFFADPENSTHVSYIIYHKSGRDAVYVNQYSNHYFDRRTVCLGQWEFDAGLNAYVIITDATGDPEGSKSINIDTVYFVYKGPPALPDLVVEDIWVEPATWCPGDEVSIYARIKNQGSSDAGGFRIYVYVDGELIVEDSAEGLGANFSTTLPSPWQYTWPFDANPHTIRVVLDPDNWVSESDETNNESSETFSAIGPPDTPIGVNASDGIYPDKVQVTWNTASGASRYEVYRATSQYGSYSLIARNVTSTSYDDTGVSPGQHYWYKVKACNDCGCSGYSSADEGWAASNPALCKSTSSLDFGASTTSKTFEVWNCGGGTLSYTISDDRAWISVSPTSGSSTGEHDTITVTVNRSGLPSGHYTGTVTIDPNYGDNQTVTVSMDVVNNPPNTPTNLSPCGVTNVSLTPTLQASSFSDPDGDNFGNSQWQVDDSSSFSSPVWDSGTYPPVMSVTVPSGVLNYSTTYWWRVRYKDSRGSWSDWSSPCSFTTKACTPPSVPGNVSASDGTYSNEVRVTWNAVRGATRYEMYRATEKCGTYVKVGESTTTTYDDTNVVARRIYWYKVRACNACGCSNDSVPDSGYAGSPAPGSSAVFRVERRTGNVYADGSYYGQCYYSGSADIAEWVLVSEEVEPGDVLEIDPAHPGYYRKARGPCSSLVAGVVSTEPGFVLGHGEDTEGKALLALIGIVPVKVTDEGGPIRPGDLLVVSSTPGYAMRWDPESGEICGLVGKALEPWEEGEGMILVILMR